MKRLLLALAILLSPVAASAQCNGIFNASNVCGTTAAGPGIPGPLPLASFALGPAGVSGDIQTNNGAGGLSALHPNASAIQFLNGASAYVTPPTFGSAAPGYVPASGGSSIALFLNQAGSFTAPPYPFARTLLSAPATYFVRTVPVAVTISIASPAVVTQTAHGYAAGQLVTFNTIGGTMPTGMTVGVIYCVLAAGLATNTYEIGATCGGSAINTTGSTSGTITAQAGNDLTGTGAAQTATVAFMTPQGAANYIAQNIDTGPPNNVVTVQLAGAGGGGSSLYTSGVQMLTPFIGSGIVYFKGDTITPSNVLIQVNGAADFQATYPGVVYEVGGFRLINSAASGSGLYASDFGTIIINASMDFNSIGTPGTSGAQLWANTGSIVNQTSAWTVSGGSGQEFKTTFGGHLENATTLTITYSGTPVFANTILATDLGNATLASITTAGTGCTGQRYAVTTNADVFTNGGGANYFCGSVAGGVATNGIYQ